MDRSVFLRVTAPAVALGLLLLATCLAGVHYIQRLQTNVATILSQNVASLQAARELELSVRQLRFHDLLYLMDPSPERLRLMEEDRQRFRDALEVARAASRTDQEQNCIRSIENGYRQYEAGQARVEEATRASFDRKEYARLIDTHPIRYLIGEPCQELVRLTKEQMEQTASEDRRVSEQTSQVMVLLGLAGPVGGLVLGYGVARGLSRSIYRLSVRVQDMAHQLDEDVASVSVAARGDLRGLDRQLQHIVGKVEEAAARLRQQQRELVRAEQLSAVGQLAAGVAHEVRNPLTGIKLLVEAALRPVNPTPLNAEDLHVIHDEIVRLEQTVQAFLDFARLPAPRRQPCDLREVVRRAWDLARARAGQQNVEVGLAMPDEPVMADVDPAQITTVLVNLCLNALDAMPRGGRLDVELSDVCGEVHVAVTDTGPGIAPEIAGRLFTPFATTKPTGTGLGLSLSRRIVDEHGGTIAAANRPGGGARFLITFPPQVAEVSRAEAVGDRR
jgi:signal transduction histidine kinase